ncbi:transporter [uncultured Muribaculum sp.]|uniref:transporter n=1 Tax=uncultured Muribaculum sp. TaxID=1918613 RepID=UPI0026103B72|nr:transporter [uncultured Muribaculum sp.]
MNASEIRFRLKPLMLPVAMLLGVLFHNYMGYVAFISPYLIFMMLLVTYCKINPGSFVVNRFVWSLLSVQVLGAAAVYVLILPAGAELAQGAFICVFCPTATAAPVVTGMLGGSVGLLASYSIVSNAAVAVLAPVLFSFMGIGVEMPVREAMTAIGAKVFPLILAPLALAFLMKVFLPKLHGSVARHQSLSFYMWAFALIIVVGNAVSFIISEPVGKVPLMLAIAAVSLFTCCAQFAIGRIIGGRFGNKISGAQGLGQKNTVLAIWMALTYLDPVASVGPASYVAWQNIINSIQLYLKTKRDAPLKQMRR